jgi:hypothetical protein
LPEGAVFSQVQGKKETVGRLGIDKHHRLPIV